MVPVGSGWEVGAAVSVEAGLEVAVGALGSVAAGVALDVDDGAGGSVAPAAGDGLAVDDGIVDGLSFGTAGEVVEVGDRRLASWAGEQAASWPSSVQPATMASAFKNCRREMVLDILSAHGKLTCCQETKNTSGRRRGMSSFKPSFFYF